MLRPASREVPFRVHGIPPRRPTWRPTCASNAAQTVPENPADDETAPPQRPVPLILLRAWSSPGKDPHLRAGAWNVAILSSLFCALTKGEAPRVSKWESLLLPNPTGESQCESIARLYRVAKLPTAVGAPQSLIVSA